MSEREPNSVVPHIMLAAAITLSGVIILNFWPLNNDDNINTQAQKKDFSNNQPVSKDFYEILKSNEVVIKETNYISTPKSAELDHPTLLQISAFGDRKHAQSLASKLRAQGLSSVRVISRSTSKGQIHLVRTLPFERYDELKTAIQIAERFNQHPQRIQIK